MDINQPPVVNNVQQQHQLVVVNEESGIEDESFDSMADFNIENFEDYIVYALQVDNGYDSDQDDHQDDGNDNDHPRHNEDDGEEADDEDEDNDDDNNAHNRERIDYDNDGERTKQPHNAGEEVDEWAMDVADTELNSYADFIAEIEMDLDHWKEDLGVPQNPTERKRFQWNLNKLLKRPFIHKSKK